MHGAFGSFRICKGFGVKTYKLDATSDEGALAHAWTERCMLDGLTRLCNETQGPLQFLREHMATFRTAWIEEPNKRLSIAMDLVHGRELNDRLLLARRGLSEEYTVKISCDLIHAVTLLHEIGVSHRDLKLDNVMLKSDGNAVLIDWGTATCGNNTVEEKTTCGSRRANSIQQLCLEALTDGNVRKSYRSMFFQRKKPSYDTKANDLVQLAHILTALWTSYASSRQLICGAFGPEWDEVSEKLTAGELLPYLERIYATIDRNPIYDFIPEPFRSIILQLIAPREEDRISLLNAWKLLHKKTYAGMRGKKYKLADFLPAPPPPSFFQKCKERLQHMVAEDIGFSEPFIPVKQLFAVWESRDAQSVLPRSLRKRQRETDEKSTSRCKKRR
eukprot:GEMP01004290.1.p1 GENE.GEMP01004290.1~~GEMP01004290.1.p1  ORF type:complete len:388 (+),score=55.91 GEMP01004290.1:359-1522(+)